MEAQSWVITCSTSIQAGSATPRSVRNQSQWSATVSDPSEREVTLACCAQAQAPSYVCLSLIQVYRLTAKASSFGCFSWTGARPAGLPGGPGPGRSPKGCVLTLSPLSASPPSLPLRRALVGPAGPPPRSSVLGVAPGPGPRPVVSGFRSMLARGGSVQLPWACLAPQRGCLNPTG